MDDYNIKRPIIQTGGPIIWRKNANAAYWTKPNGATNAANAAGVIWTRTRSATTACAASKRNVDYTAIEIDEIIEDEKDVPDDYK
jgi:hypothetical protein